jgi:hypothetical protein
MTVLFSVHEKSAFKPQVIHPPLLSILTSCPAWMDSRAVRQAGMRIFETARLRAKNDDGDLSVDQILLVFDTLIQGEKDIEFSDFCCCEEVAIFQPGQPSVADSLAVLAGQMIA